MSGRLALLGPPDSASTEYAEVPANPRHFAVLPDHVYAEVEQVVRTSEQYVIVEKMAKAAEIVELLDGRFVWAGALISSPPLPKRKK